MIRAALLAFVPSAVLAQAAAPAAPAAPAPPVEAVTLPAPVEHRLTPDEIAAAQADGAERNRAADLLAATQGDAALALPGEKRKPQIHGEAGVALGSNGYRDVFASETTTLADGTTVSVAGDYSQYNSPFRTRRPN